MALNGAGIRACANWIDDFVKFTDNTESAEIWRRWCAITAIAAVLEQKVWTDIQSNLYPNLYVFLVGDAGLGKSRVIKVAQGFLRTIKDFKFGATSMTMASLVDLLADQSAKRVIIREHGKIPALEYNALMILADELSAFFHKYDDELIAGLTTFYDCGLYAQARRTGDLRRVIENPIISILSGTTPTNLIHLIPEYAWEQGFMSRVILVYSNDRPLIDVFNCPPRAMPKEMLHDLEIINSLHGEFGWSEEWSRTMQNWRKSNLSVDGFTPPTHPKLKGYCSRRFAHMIKLSMVASVARNNTLRHEIEDFNTAMRWMIEAEHAMGDIFHVGVAEHSSDGSLMDDIIHFVSEKGTATEAQIIAFARKRTRYAQTLPKIIGVMEQGHLIVHCGNTKPGGWKIFKCPGV